VVDSIHLESSTAARAARDCSLATLSAVADPVRWIVLRRLADGRACVCELQELTGVAPNLLSYHLRVLREANLVTTSRRGRWVDYELAEDTARRIHGALPTKDAAAVPQ
jgi:ArsR family transcriptional regulator